jgi:glucan 1,3-beta-glucosidase
VSFQPCRLLGAPLSPVQRRLIIIIIIVTDTDSLPLAVTIWMGVYIGDNATVNEQQKSEALDVLQSYGTEHVSGVTVGNEYLLNAVDKTAAATFILSEVSDVSRLQLEASLAALTLFSPSQFKTRLSALNLAKTLPVGTADAGSEITATLAAGVD